MSFTVKIQKNTSDSNVVNKNITDVLSLNGTLKEGTSIITPVITVQADLDDIATSNYATIDEFGRSYYIDDIVSLRNGLVELSMRCDVLYTYRNKIRQQTCLVERQENESNLYLSDPRIKVQANPYVQNIEFDYGFEGGWTYCLAVAGN